MQVEPAAGPGVQDQPGELEAAEKVVLAGTVSRRVGAAASRFPVFLRLRDQVSVESGVAVPDARVFVRERLGEPPRGVVVVEQLLAAGSPAVDVELQAVLVTEVADAGRVGSIRSPKVAVWEAPGASEPIANVQAEPGLGEGEQDHPDELAAESNRVKGGTVSESETPLAVATPWLRTVRV